MLAHLKKVSPPNLVPHPATVRPMHEVDQMALDQKQEYRPEYNKKYIYNDKISAWIQWDIYLSAESWNTCRWKYLNVIYWSKKFLFSDVWSHPKNSPEGFLENEVLGRRWVLPSDLLYSANIFLFEYFPFQIEYDLESPADVWQWLQIRNVVGAGWRILQETRTLDSER